MLLSHPFGNPTAYHAARALHERGGLDSFHTCLFRPLGMDLRGDGALEREPVRTYPLREAARLACRKIGLFREFDWVQWVCDGFDRSVSRRIRPGIDAVYCYEDSARYTFEAAREVGAETLYELPAGYFRAVEEIAAAEIERDGSIGAFLIPYPEPAAKRTRKDAELRLADVVFCASQYSAATVRRYDPNKRIVVLPYGADTSLPPRRWEKCDDGPLRVLYAGTLNPRKGLHYLFEALSALPGGEVELALAGTWKPGFEGWLRERFPAVRYDFLGRVSHKRLQQIYRNFDVFAFPTLSDGFGLVILEAMAAGIPVIATERSGGPDVIEEGRNGFIVPAGHAGALRRTIERCAGNRDVLPAIGARARATAEAFSWGRYRESFLEVVVGRGGLKSAAD